MPEGALRFSRVPFKVFALVATLAQRLSTGDAIVRRRLAALDFKTLAAQVTSAKVFSLVFPIRVWPGKAL